jgi:hypothetical protein
VQIYINDARIGPDDVAFAMRWVELRVADGTLFKASRPAYGTVKLHGGEPIAVQVDYVDDARPFRPMRMTLSLATVPAPTETAA